MTDVQVARKEIANFADRTAQGWAQHRKKGPLL
eukprot:CAMPEP_0206520270 /NCGR_PEP_ID=MMETSP0324_2-20121206/65664_1 /ASSEMBLY_ACC=CAM_ASM_000836 /TAXON_ID=2866 /ORGANISM="Crypthecodinium cohnii, Strain Seligo" /LENGTH=32 /DNA_ID= /DNA_START= /DNA_END= /DNA_ORIENTATION=